MGLFNFKKEKGLDEISKIIIKLIERNTIEYDSLIKENYSGTNSSDDIIYISYLVYITNNLLNKKYNKNIVDKIINKILKESIEVNYSKELVNDFNSIYQDLLKTSPSFESNDSLSSLTSSLLTRSIRDDSLSYLQNIMGVLDEFIEEFNRTIINKNIIIKDENE